MTNTEQSFSPPPYAMWRFACLIVGFASGSAVPKIWRGESEGVIFIAIVALIGFLATWLISRFVRIKVSSSTIGDLPWSDIAYVTPAISTLLLPGLLLSSTTARTSVHVPKVIATDPRFVELVERYTPAGHPLQSAVQNLKRAG